MRLEYLHHEEPAATTNGENLHKNCNRNGTLPVAQGEAWVCPSPAFHLHYLSGATGYKDVQTALSALDPVKILKKRACLIHLHFRVQISNANHDLYTIMICNISYLTFIIWL